MENFSLIPFFSSLVWILADFLAWNASPLVNALAYLKLSDIVCLPGMPSSQHPLPHHRGSFSNLLGRTIHTNHRQ